MLGLLSSIACLQWDCEADELATGEYRIEGTGIAR